MLWLNLIRGVGVKILITIKDTIISAESPGRSCIKFLSSIYLNEEIVNVIVFSNVTICYKYYHSPFRFKHLVCIKMLYIVFV